MIGHSTVRLADLCELVREPVKPGERPKALYLGLEHLASGKLVRTGGGQASEMRSTMSAFQPDDVLYGKLRPYLDKAVLADISGVCTTELLVLRAKADVDPRFIVAVVHSHSFLEYAISGTTGVQHPRTSWSHTREFEVPAFTFDEQKRIADLLWLVHGAIGLSETLVQEGQALKRAAMRMLFTRGLRSQALKETEVGPMPKSWDTVPLGDLCNGFDTVSLQEEGNREIEYIDVSSVSREFLRIESTSRFVLRDAPSRARKRILTDDVLFATVRPTLLRVALVPAYLNNQVCSTAFCVLRQKPEINADHFIYYLVQREQFVQQLALIETGASYPAVTDRIVKEQIVPVPSVKEQHEIVKILNAIDRKIDLHRQKRAVLDDLFKALLHKLMTGEIHVGHLDLSVFSER